MSVGWVKINFGEPKAVMCSFKLPNSNITVSLELDFCKLFLNLVLSVSSVLLAATTTMQSPDCERCSSSVIIIVVG